MWLHESIEGMNIIQLPCMFVIQETSYHLLTYEGLISCRVQLAYMYVPRLKGTPNLYCLSEVLTISTG